MARFLQQFDSGSGDYTKEREGWLTETDIDSIASQIPKKSKKR
jgi:hypothetical protein